jgi:hypothetical protein
METKQIEQLAIELIAKHLPNQNWQFIWNNRINSLGVCKYNTKQIGLSSRWVRKLPKEEIVDTLLHEIAHAIAGYEAGHGHRWKVACVTIGATPERLAKVGIKREDVAIPLYQMVTPAGKTIKNYFRKPAQSTYMNLRYYYEVGNKAATLGKMQIKKISILDIL